MTRIVFLYHVLDFLKHQKPGIIIKNALKTWVDVKTLQNITCQWCIDKGPAIGFCKDCSKLIDRQCVKFHQKIGPYRLHSTVDIRPGGPNLQISMFSPRKTCERHGNRRLNHYCSRSGILLCDECMENEDFNVDVIEHFFSLQDAMYDSKRLIEEILNTHQYLPEHSVLTTMLTWIDVALGLIPDYEHFTEVPLSPDIQKILHHECLSSNQVFIRCSDVHAKIVAMQRDMRVEFLSGRRAVNEQQSMNHSLSTRGLSQNSQHNENVDDSQDENPADVGVLQGATKKPDQSK